MAGSAGEEFMYLCLRLSTRPKSKSQQPLHSPIVIVFRASMRHSPGNQLQRHHRNHRCNPYQIPVNSCFIRSPLFIHEDAPEHTAILFCIAYLYFRAIILARKRVDTWDSIRTTTAPTIIR